LTSILARFDERKDPFSKLIHSFILLKLVIYSFIPRIYHSRIERPPIPLLVRIQHITFVDEHLVHLEVDLQATCQVTVVYRFGFLKEIMENCLETSLTWLSD
jgi:hypothetical protein